MLDNNIPHLLSVGLLDHVGAIIDLPNNCIKYQKSNHVDKMHKLDSGHRAIQIVPRSSFSKDVVSPQMCTDFGLSPEDFSSRGAYKERPLRFSIASQPCEFASQADIVGQPGMSCCESEVTSCESDPVHAVISSPQVTGLGLIEQYGRNNFPDTSSLSSLRHGEGTSSSMEASVSSNPICHHTLHAADGASAHGSKGYEELVSSSAFDRVERGTEGLSSSNLSSSTRRESVGKVGELSEVFGEVVLHGDQEPQVQGKGGSEDQSSAHSGGDHGSSTFKLSNSHES